MASGTTNSNSSSSTSTSVTSSGERGNAPEISNDINLADALYNVNMR